MYDGQNSKTSVNLIFHMNPNDNIQVVPTAESKNTFISPHHSANYVTSRPTPYIMANDHSAPDLHQIPLTVNSEFFTTDSNEETNIADNCVYSSCETNATNDHNGHGFGATVISGDHNASGSGATIIPEVTDAHAQCWSSGAHADTRMVVEDFQFSAGSNLDLQKATAQALQSGTIMPLVKEELKCSIQNKRHKEGKGELVVSFEDPVPGKLSAEEEVKVELRRTQNREAARRFRNKQKRKTDSLEKECRRLEAENNTLKSEQSKLKRERDDLAFKLEQHLTICPLFQNIS